MNKQQQHFNQRFPYGRDSVKFMKPKRSLPVTEIGELRLSDMPTFDAVEIPAGIVEHIYKMGWEDAIHTARDVISEECL